MLRIILAATAVAAVLGVGGRAAAAERAPWCVMSTIGWGDTVWDCSYWTFKQCIPYAIAGLRGFCEPNPYYTAPRRGPVRHKRSR